MIEPDTSLGDEEARQAARRRGLGTWIDRWIDLVSTPGYKNAFARPIFKGETLLGGRQRQAVVWPPDWMRTPPSQGRNKQTKQNNKKTKHSGSHNRKRKKMIEAFWERTRYANGSVRVHACTESRKRFVKRRSHRTNEARRAQQHRQAFFGMRRVTHTARIAGDYATKPFQIFYFSTVSKVVHKTSINHGTGFRFQQRVRTRGLNRLPGSCHGGGIRSAVAFDRSIAIDRIRSNSRTSMRAIDRSIRRVALFFLFARCMHMLLRRESHQNWGTHPPTHPHPHTPTHPLPPRQRNSCIHEQPPTLLYFAFVAPL
jgi:hypothetical protein